jgi:hypothetical protein
MYLRIRSRVSPSQPVLSITHELMHGATESTVSLMVVLFGEHCADEARPTRMRRHLRFQSTTSALADR